MTALAAIAGDLTAAQRAHFLAAIPRALQQAAHAQVAATEAALYGDFLRWVAGGGAAEEWAGIYAATVGSRAQALYTTTAQLTLDYTAVATGGATQATLPLWEAAEIAGEIADAAWRFTSPKYLGEMTADGVPRAVAVDRAARNAQQLGSLDVGAAQRHAIADTNPAARQRKVTSSGACGWCVAVAGKTYAAKARVPGHANDHCGVVPVVDGDGYQEPQPLEQGELEDLLEVPATDITPGAPPRTPEIATQPLPPEAPEAIDLGPEDLDVPEAPTPAATKYGAGDDRVDRFDDIDQRMASDDWQTTLSEDEQEAVRSYTHGSDHIVNGYLRGARAYAGDPDLAEQARFMIADLDAALATYAEPYRPDVVWRGIAPGPDSPLDALEDAYQTGTTFEHLGYASTTTRPAIAESFSGTGGVLLEIDRPPVGAPLIAMSRYDTEAEWLIPHGARIQIYDKVDGFITSRPGPIELEEIMDQASAAGRLDDDSEIFQNFDDEEFDAVWEELADNGYANRGRRMHRTFYKARIVE